VPFAAILLALMLALFSRGVQERLQRVLRQSPIALIAVPVLLSAFFCTAAAHYGALSFPLAGAILAFTLAPTIVVLAFGTGRKPGALADLAAILLLWLPLEFGAGASLVPRPVQGVLHAIIYGVAILLGLILFLVYREMPGMRYQLPRRWSDFTHAALGLAIAAAILIPLGLAIGFLNPPHHPPVTGSRLALRIAFIFFGTALPEEILFRALIQNWLVQRFGDSLRSVAGAALIFGAAHLDNGPQPLPNWRYMIVATIAGFIFGLVFRKSTSVIASALTHTGVNTVKYVWF
jgi:membrane protease YdiL (CAAX protease family)